MVEEFWYNSSILAFFIQCNQGAWYSHPHTSHDVVVERFQHLGCCTWIRMMELEQGTNLKVDVNNDAKIRDIAIMTSPRHHLLLVSYKFRALFSWLLPNRPPGNDAKNQEIPVEFWSLGIKGSCLEPLRKYPIPLSISIRKNACFLWRSDAPA